MSSNSTIAAIATAAGFGGIGIVRISGPLSRAIAVAITNQKLKPRVATYTNFLDKNKNIIDTGIAIFFENPNSFTGEDVLELQGHGGTVVLNQIFKRVLELGATIANPGEFSQRAFLNDKIDLAQAEAIGDLISAKSEQAARGAVNSLQGKFSQEINSVIDEIVKIRVFVEAALDFPDEEIDFWQDNKISQQINNLILKIEKIIKQSTTGKILKEGLKIVLAGEPNAGKSTLLNALADDNIAIVTSIPGTTRDILSTEINLDGIPLKIIDTAGLRDSEDIIEQEGIKRAFTELEKADFLFLIIDVQKIKEIENFEKYFFNLLGNKKLPKNILVILNKIDVINSEPKAYNESEFEIVQISADKQIGLNLIKDYIKQKSGYVNSEEGIFISRTRHITALEKALNSLQDAYKNICETQQGDFAAEDLRLAHDTLGQITGKMTADDLLGEIFGNFCIGK